MADDARPPKRVLIVDDSPDLRSLLEMGLGLSGYQCVTAEHGAAAIPVVQKERFDAILLDLQMPVMDGLRFLEWLRKEARNPVPVLVFSSTDADAEGEATRDRALALGANDFLPKPAQLPAVLEKLGRMLDSSV